MSGSGVLAGAKYEYGVKNQPPEFFLAYWQVDGYLPLITRIGTMLEEC